MYPLLMHYYYFYTYIIHTFTNVILRLVMTDILLLIINIITLPRGGQPPNAAAIRQCGLSGGAQPPQEETKCGLNAPVNRM